MTQQYADGRPARPWQRISLSHRARRNAAEAVAAMRIDADSRRQTGAGASGRHKRRHDHDCADGHAAELWAVFPGQIAVLDGQGVVVCTNQAWQDFGQTVGAPAAAVGVNYLDWCQRAANEPNPAADELGVLVAEALTGVARADSAERQLYQVVVGDTRRWFRVQVLPLPGRDGGALVLQDDVTPEKELEEDLRHRAFHDPLTGLPNRALLLDRLEHAVAGAVRDGKSLAVLFVDLDEFKSVNDRLGHLAGDSVLCQAAQRLADCIRVSDTVGRWGGDEFVVVAERLDNTVTADVLAERIGQSLQDPMTVNDREVCIRASIGVAQLDQQPSATQLVEEADRALIAQRERTRHPAAQNGISSGR